MITDAGVKDLPPTIEKLDLYACNITLAGFNLLPAALKELHFGGTNKQHSEDLRNLLLSKNIKLFWET